MREELERRAQEIDKAFSPERRRSVMGVTHVVFDADSFGITQKSLKMLRDAIAERSTHRIAVVEIPTNDLCCGYLILDWERQDATWTGDGFRTDRCGEGGAGYRSAETLFGLFGIRPILWETVNIEELYTLPEEDIEKRLLKLSRKIAEELSEQEFRRPVDKEPNYIRSAI